MNSKLFTIRAQNKSNCVEKNAANILFFNILCSVLLLCVIVVFIALVGSLQLSLMLVLAPFTESLLDWCGLRNISFAGGFLFSVGLISASYVNTIYGLFPTFVLIFPVVTSFIAKRILNDSTC